jgi:hypothetical protein
MENGTNRVYVERRRAEKFASVDNTVDHSNSSGEMVS